MNKEQRRKLFFIWDVLLSLLLAAAGICLMVQCYGIYRGGPYTPEAVEAAFVPIRVPVYACAAMIVLRLLACLLEEPAPKKTQRQPHMVYRRAAARADVPNCPEPEKAQILTLRKDRKQRTVVAWIALAACSAPFLVYALNSAHFTEDVTGSMAIAVRYLLAAMALPFTFAVYAAYRNRASMEQEIELLKKAPRLSGVPAAKKNALPAVRLTLLIAAAVLVVVGLNLGGTRDVLTKAINICTECVGLG